MTDNFSMVFFIFLFLFLLFIPFFPSLIVFISKKNSIPIKVNLNFFKDPAYFGKSFMRILTNAFRSAGIEKINNIREPIISVHLSLPKGLERVDILRPDYIKHLDREHKNIVIFTGNTKIKISMQFHKEVLVTGDLVIKAPCVFRALFVEGEFIIAGPTNIIRWLHVNKNLTISAPTNLGHNAYIGGRVYIKNHVNFERLFAKTIETTEEPLIDQVFDPSNAQTSKGKCYEIGDIIKIDGEKQQVVIEEDIFSDKDVHINGNVWLKCNIFTQGSIYAKNGVVLGIENKIKSMIAKKGIYISGKFKAYGYLHTEGKGEIR